jgi:hypothetical protein
VPDESLIHYWMYCKNAKNNGLCQSIFVECRFLNSLTDIEMFLYFGYYTTKEKIMEEQCNSACNIDEIYFNWCKKVNPYESPCDQHDYPGVFWKYCPKKPGDENCKKKKKDCEMKSRNNNFCQKIVIFNLN